MKKTIITLIYLVLIVCFSKPSFSSNLDNSTGEERVKLLLKLCSELVEVDPVLTSEYAKESLNLSESLNLQDYMVDSYNYIGYAYYNKDLFDESLVMFKEAYSLSLEIDYLPGQAFSKNGYGLGAFSLGDYTNSLKYFNDSFELYTTLKDENGIALTLGNKASVYESLGDYDLSLEHYIESYKLFESIGNQEEFANTSLNIGYIYEQIENTELTVEYYERALTIYEETDNQLGIAIASNNFGNFFKDLGFYEEAQKSYLKALSIYIKFEKSNEIASIYNNIGFLLELNGQFEDAIELYKNAVTLSSDTSTFEDMVIYNNNIGSAYNKLGIYDLALEHHHESLDMAQEIGYEKGIESSIRNLAIDYEMFGNYEDSNYYYSLYAEIKDVLAEKANFERFAKLSIAVEKEQDVTKIEEQKEKLVINARRLLYSIVGIGISLVILSIVSVLGILIAKERKKSDKLLLNILPIRVANELKATGKTTPEHFENVTVYFSDIVNFTKTSSNLDPTYLINELSDIFTTFDNIMELHHCERIKTIGDAYFAVCGLPNSDEQHVQNIINASVDILAALHKRNSESEIKWRIRIGIHTGSVTGGVVGTKKYIYDVFGDTINTASRMESNSEPMRINVSETTYELIKDDYNFAKREPLEVKGKGIFQMYFLELPSQK